MDINFAVQVGNIVIAVVAFFSAIYALGRFLWRLIEKHFERESTLKTLVFDFKQFRDEIKLSLDEIKSTLKEHESKLSVLMQRKIADSHSPLELNDEGKRMLEASGGQVYVDENKDALVSEIKNKKPKGHYDIQEFSRQVIGYHKHDFAFNAIKENCYQNGFSVEEAILCMGIYLSKAAIQEISFPSSTN